MEFYARKFGDKEEIILYPQTSGEEAWLRVVFAYMRHLRMARLQPITDLPSKDVLSGRKKKPKKKSNLAPCEEIADEPQETPAAAPTAPPEWPFRFTGRAALRSAVAETGAMLFSLEVPFDPLDLRKSMDIDDEIATLRATQKRVAAQLYRSRPYIEAPSPVGFALGLLELLEKGKAELAAEREQQANGTSEEV